MDRKWLQYNGKPKHDCASASCCKALSELTGISCRIPNCVCKRVSRLSKICCHDSCLLSFQTGDTKICEYCCIWLHIVCFKFSEHEYFAPEFDAN